MRKGKILLTNKHTIQGVEYSAAAARKECSNILNHFKYEPNGDVIGEKFDWLKNAFEEHHYNPTEKIPHPITRIWVKPSSSGSNYQFHIEMENGQTDHIGYTLKCFVTSAKRVKLIEEDNVIDAARQMIRPQQDEARQQFINSNNLLCNECGKEIAPSELHADHDNPSFKTLFNDWLEKESIKKSEIQYRDVDDAVRAFKDEALGENWCKYHKSRFRPQPTHAECNLRKGKN